MILPVHVMIVDKIQEYIGDHSAPGVLFVIKGYAFTEFESCATSLGKTIEDKGSSADEEFILVTE